MEQVMERAVPAKYAHIVLYDDYGNRVTNIKTLRAIAEGQKIIAEWEKRMEKFEREDGHED